MTRPTRMMWLLSRRLGVDGVNSRALAVIGLVITAGWGAAGLCAVYGVGSWSTFALLVAAALVMEWLQVPGDEDPLDAAGAQAFSFSSGIHIAAVVLVGPFAAALLAVTALVVVDALRRESPVKIAFNAGVFALASVAAGGAFVAAGGSVGQIDLPSDLAAVALLWLTYAVANTLLVSVLVSIITRVPLVLLLDQKLRSEFASAAGEAGLGICFALFVGMNGWGTLFLVPLVFGVYQARARLAQVRIETARSLQTLASVIDERDPNTHRHSERVASSVHELAGALDLPATSLLTLRWAGRLHDLGKIAVDSSVLMKPSKLNDEEWAVMRRHPRLSARLLRRFRFATRHTRVVECHHERFDGRGYYGVPPEAIPIEAYFIAVADSFDAMVSDRPYRSGLAEEEALLEIERGAGTQFHPLVARAFVALKRGLDPKDELSSDELHALSKPFAVRRRIAVRMFVSALHERQPGALVFAAAAYLAALASGLGLAILATSVALALVLAAMTIDRLRSLALSRRLRRCIRPDSDTDTSLHALRDVVATAAHPTWAALVEWDSRRLEGDVVSAVGVADNAAVEEKITSWLLRDADEGADLLRSVTDELDGEWLALSLEPPNATDHSVVFAIFAFARPPAHWFAQALVRARLDISHALLSDRVPPVPPVREAVCKRLGSSTASGPRDAHEYA